MKDPAVERQTRTLLNVLNLEAKYGFNNSAVVGGGLDGMWPNLDRVSGLVRNLAPMNGRRYASMSQVERRTWSNAAMRRLGGSDRESASVASKPRQPRLTSPEVPHKNRSQSSVRRALGLETPVDTLSFLHPATKRALDALELRKTRDVLWHFPLRLIDYTKRTSIVDLIPDEEATVEGEVVSSETNRFSGRGGLARVRIRDGTGFLTITWFNMPYMAARWQNGDRIVVSGKVGDFRGRPTMENPEYDDVTRGGKNNQRGFIHAGALVPVYPLSAGLNQRTVRNGVMQCLDNGLRFVEETLSEETRRANDLMSLQDAIEAMHRPMTERQHWRAIRRLAFDEFLYNQIAAIRRRTRWRDSVTAVGLEPDRALVHEFVSSLGFDLTPDQSESVDTIIGDMGSDFPMARLLQGEVGSGKTVVAIAAMLSASGVNGKQSAMMAPTEVLAEQHFLSMLEQLKCREELSGYGPVYESPSYRVESRDRYLRIGLLTGSLGQREKRVVQSMCAEGELDLVVGTHALLQEAVDFDELALVVVDEQQRFGTEQRAVLTSRSPRPHMLAMSATPIPRTLHMTMYGEMELSTLRAMPRGRTPIETRWAQTPFDVTEAYSTIRNEVHQGRQAFVVCPLIEPSENVRGASALVEFDRLSREEFPDLNVGLLHGRMNLAEKQSVMDAFRNEEIDVLVATPVIEVGVDVPNATVMLIMTADHFGLSQLHQIRGRVGRGRHKSTCFLISDTGSEIARARLQAVVENLDGFELARKDLEIRGPGRNLAEVQSGWSGWRFARFDDFETLGRARSTTEDLLTNDFDLKKPE
ncbi:MAG: ATP-dependent DNA helicase RecG, partial [Chloroflexi bacterium]|nr:ATP-dependent DNA helicase RecG [Chloroflexota bacterium]